MKRLWFAFVFLLIAIGLCTFEQYSVRNTYNTLSKLTASLEESAEKEDYKACEETSKKIEKIWMKQYPYMSAMIEHTSLDDAKITIFSLSGLAKEEEKEELLSKIGETKYMLEAIYKSQLPTFGNIF